MPPVQPMLAKAVTGIPDPARHGGLSFEPKWDGFRCIVFRDGDEVELGSRNEKPLTRYFPELPPGDGMIFEPKWDGFRCIVFRDGDEVELTSRNTKPLTRYFPELVAAIREQLPERIVLDGEVFVAVGDRLEF